MNLFSFFDRFRAIGSKRAKDRPGAPRVVEAALRSKRALEHLNRRQREAAREPQSAPGKSGYAESGYAEPVYAEPVYAEPVHAEAGFRLEPTPRPPANGKRNRAVAGQRGASASNPSLGRSPKRAGRPPQPAPVARSSTPRAGAARTIVPQRRPLPRFVTPLATLLAGGLGYAASVPLFEGAWLPRAPLARVAVSGATVRGSESIARALLDQAGAPLDRLDRERVATKLLADPWIESAESFRLPTGTLIVRVVERRAIARYRRADEDAISLLDPTGRPFRGAVEAGGALPLVTVPAQAEETPLPASALEVLAELRRHGDLAGDPTALTLFLPGAAPEPIEPDETGFVLELGRGGPRALLGQTYLKRRIARLATLLAQRDAWAASARVIDLRYADRAVLRTGPASG